MISQRAWGLMVSIVVVAMLVALGGWQGGVAYAQLSEIAPPLQVLRDYPGALAQPTGYAGRSIRHGVCDAQSAPVRVHGSHGKVR